jgi:hypothetical protein
LARDTGTSWFGEAVVADRLYALSDAGLLAQLVLGEVERRRLPARDARDRDVAVLVVERREEMDHARERVRERTPEAAGVHGLLEHAQLDDARHDAAERRRERGLAETPVPAVGDDHGVAVEVGALLLKVPAQVLGARFLLALDEHGNADRRLAVERAERRDVRDDSGFVVLDAAPVQAAVPERRRERRRPPLRLRSRRLHVVVRVKENRGRAGRRLHVSDDSGMALRAQDLHVRAHRAEHRRDRLGRTLERLFRPILRADRWDRDERLEVFTDL